MSIRSKMRAKMRSVDKYADVTLVNNAKHITEYSATPNAVISAPLGSLCWDYTNSDIYFKTDALAGTAWSRVVN